MNFYQKYSDYMVQQTMALMNIANNKNKISAPYFKIFIYLSNAIQAFRN